ncbi:MAG: glucose 1-dehydrogenase [Spirochaetales bacterium]|nr:glucose 1-dehydrogenase [Spirochaetales bacterium]
MKHRLSFDLTGKTALVTGAKRGIGRAIAEALAEAGAHIIAQSATLKETDPVVSRIREIGGKCAAYSCDLGDRQGVYDFINSVKAEQAGVDILVNNAGTILRSPAVEHSDDDWDRVMSVNLDAPFILSREFGREMIGRGGGKIVNTASLLTYQGGITVPGYAASKGALGQLTKALANEWASLGVNVNAVAPGYIATDNTAALQNDEVRNRQILERIPAGRWGKAEDIAGTVLFLCSPAADYIHGTIIDVDGGWMAR